MSPFNRRSSAFRGLWQTTSILDDRNLHDPQPGRVPRSRMSFDEPPIITRNVPGSTTHRSVASSICRCSGPSSKTTSFAWPGSRWTRSNPFSSMTGRATDASTSRTSSCTTSSPARAPHTLRGRVQPTGSADLAEVGCACLPVPPARRPAQRPVRTPDLLTYPPGITQQSPCWGTWCGHKPVRFFRTGRRQSVGERVSVDSLTGGRGCVDVGGRRTWFPGRKSADTNLSAF